jgi:Kef-type K+ transport system membrane component KefB
MITATSVQPGSFLAIVVATAVAGIIASMLRLRTIAVPVVVLELVFGVVLGPHVLGLKVTPFIAFFGNVGLGLLFFFAGYEIDVNRIRGAPLELALAGWAMSLAIAYAVGGALAAAGVVLSLVYTGSALVSTALGMLIPILSDAGELRTKLGTYLTAAGAVGEFGPILLLTLVLSAQSTLHNGVILLAFVVTAVVVALLALRSSEHTLPLFASTLEASSQLAVRTILVLVFALAALAYELGLDLVLGGFAAGLITRQLLKERELPVFDSKLKAVGFGVFIPFFFVVSGMKLDISALAHPSGIEKLVLFFFLFLVVRGTPALLLYRKVLDRRQRIALALLSSAQLPMVVAIVDVAVSSGHMRRSTAAALVGAAAISTLVYPILGLRVNASPARPAQQPEIDSGSDPHPA